MNRSEHNHVTITLFLCLFILANPFKNISGQNIGIGTDTPTDKLHVYSGNVRIENNIPFLLINSLMAGYHTGISLRELDVNKGVLYYDGYDDVLRMATDVDGLRNDFTIDNSGNIGIGTALPVEKLHIDYGNLRIRNHHPWIMLDGMQEFANTGLVFQHQNTIQAYMYYSNEYDLLRMTTDSTGTRDDISLDTLGNVGIGTTSPLERLHIHFGNLRVDNGWPFIYMNTLGAGNNTGMVFQEQGISKGIMLLDGSSDLLRITTDTTGIRADFAMNTAGNIGIGTNNPTTKLHVSGGDIQVDDDYSYLFLNATNGGNGGIGFKENGSDAAWIFFRGANNLLRLSNSVGGARNDLAITMDGKVGIGTDAPNNLLHVFGGDAEIEDYYPYLYLNDTTATNGGGKAGLGFQYNGVNKAILNYDIPNDYIKLTTDDAGVRYDLIVNSAGNIGIGLSNPTQKLHITGGDIQLDDSDYPFLILNQTVVGGNGGLCVKETGTSKAWIYYKGAEDVLCLTTSTSGSRFDISVTPSGNVGIGTASPEEKLHVEGTIEVDQMIQANDAGGLDFATDDGVIRLKISDAGNIGIGTTAPEEALHVEGTIEVDQMIQANDAGGLDFASDDGVIRLKISDAGNIGIGTTAPEEALHVEGTIEVDQMIKANDAGGLEFATDDGVLRMKLVDAGNVGIGTASPGLHRLYVASQETGAAGATGFFENYNAAGIALSVENSNSSSSDNVLLVTSKGVSGNLARFDSYHGNPASGWDQEFRFTNDGDGRCDGSWVTGGADYAEFFPMAYPEEILEPGDVIAMSELKGYTVEKASSARNQLVLGVYSTKPAVIGNSCAEDDPEDAALVGLIGVVPTKVCMENGPIRIGDFVTISSSRGIAARAMTSGMMIGRALEDHEGPGEGMIKVMVDVSWVNMDTPRELELLKAEIQQLRSMISQMVQR